MSDLEDLLTRELGSVADAERAPRVDLGGVRRVGRRERRRRRTAVVAVVAALILGLGGAVAGTRGGSEVPVAAYDLPLGSSLTVPWTAADDTVHVGALSLVVPNLRQGESRGGTTVLATQVDDEPLAWSRLVVGDDALTLAPLGPVQESPSVSYDGRWVAWVGQSRSSMRHVTLLDTQIGAESGTDVDVSSAATNLAVGTVDAAGRVVLYDPGKRTLLWVPGADPVPLTGLPKDTAAVSLTAYGLALVAEDHVSGTPPVVWRVADYGTATRVGPIGGVSRDVGGIAPDGQHYVTVLGGDEMAFAELKPDGASTVGGPLPLPSGATGWSQLGWESATDMVFARSGARGLDLLRCSATTDECERVPDKVWSGFGYE